MSGIFATPKRLGFGTSEDSQLLFQESDGKNGPSFLDQQEKV